MAYKKAKSDPGSWQKTIKDALKLARKTKKLSQKTAYMRVTLHDGDSFYLSGWSCWEEDRTGEKIVLLIGRDRSVITESRNISKFEFFYKKPKEKSAIGIKY